MLLCRSFGAQPKLSLSKPVKPKPCFWLTTIVIIIFLVFLMSVVVPERASAKTGLSVCPSSISLETPPGFNETRVLKLSNSGSGTVIVNVQPAGIVEDDKGNSVYEKQNSDGITSVKWLSVEPSKVILKPESTAYVKLTVSVPSDMRLGDHRAAILFEIGDAEASNISIASRLVSSVLLHTRNAPATPYFEVESFKSGGVNIGGPLEFDLSMRNDGKIPYKTSGKIKVMSGDNKQVSEVALPNVSIPPGSSKNIAIKSKIVLSNGVYRCSMFIESDGYFKGPYTRTLIVFPWVGFLGLIMIALSLYFIRPKRKPRF
jgi:hypothetical protein